MEEIEEIMEEDEYTAVDLDEMRQRIVEFASGRVIFIKQSFEIRIERTRSSNLCVELVEYQNKFDSTITGRWVYTPPGIFSGNDIATIAERVYRYFDRIIEASSDIIEVKYYPDHIGQQYYIEVHNQG